MKSFTLRRILVTMVFAAAGVAGATPADAPALSDSVQIRAQLRAYFFDAARQGRLDMLNEFVVSNYDLNTRDEMGYTALILAAYHGQEGAVEKLLVAGADPCAQDKRGNTALMGAIFKGNLSIAKRLLHAACEPDQRNNAGQTAAMYAALFKRVEILNELVTQGADLSAKDIQGNDAAGLKRGEFVFSPVPSR